MQLYFTRSLAIHTLLVFFLFGLYGLVLAEDSLLIGRAGVYSTYVTVCWYVGRTCYCICLTSHHYQTIDVALWICLAGAEAPVPEHDSDKAATRLVSMFFNCILQQPLNIEAKPRQLLCR